MKATPIACTMYVPAPPQPRYRPRRSLVDVPLPPPVVIERPPGLLANLAVKLQEACGVPDSEWVRRRHPHSVSCRRAAAVVLRRVILPGMAGPSSYPDIAAAMGRRHHSSVITMCHQLR